MYLIGIDIGYSRRRQSNGVAVFRDGELQSLKRLGVNERNEALRSIHNADVVAIDAPLLPAGAPDTLVRHCERVFSRGVFQKRCKPGMSHIRGTGQSLRAHGRMAAKILVDQRALRPATGSPTACLRRGEHRRGLSQRLPWRAPVGGRLRPGSMMSGSL